MDIERDRQVRGAAASCLVAVVVYHDAGETPQATAALGAAVREVIARCGDGGMGPDQFVTSVLYPPLRGLVDLYGPVCGRELFAAFLLTFLEISDAVVSPRPHSGAVPEKSQRISTLAVAEPPDRP